MLKKIRRNSKQLLETRRNSSVATATSRRDSKAAIPKRKNLTFFDLPAELRNAIYEDIASGTRICVPSPTKKPQNKKDVPSLLLVSKQTRQEYLPLLLECASIAVVVKDFDFRNLSRITSSLYRTELKSLRNNSNLTICLLVDKPTKDSMSSLRRWLENRSKGLDRLGWHYVLIWSREYQMNLVATTELQRINIAVARTKIINMNLEAMSQLHCNVGEALQFELQPVIAAFEGEWRIR